MIAYDLYHAEEVRESVIANSSNSPNTRLLSMKLAKPSKNIGDTEPLTSPHLVSRPSRGYFGEITDYAAIKEQAMLDEEDDFGSSSWKVGKTRDFVS